MGGVKLGDLLPDDLESAGGRAVEELKSRENIGCLSVAWDLVDGQLQGALRSALDCDLLEVLAECWATSRLLAEYADPAKHPPGSSSVVLIGGRDVTRKVHPVVKVEVGSCPCVDLRFTFAVTAHFSGVKLIISGGRIRGGSLGDTSVSAELSYEDVPLHSPAESKKLSLGGDFTLPGEGVRIPRFTT